MGSTAKAMADLCANLSKHTKLAAALVSDTNVAAAIKSETANVLYASQAMLHSVQVSNQLYHVLKE